MNLQQDLNQEKSSRIVLEKRVEHLEKQIKNEKTSNNDNLQFNKSFSPPEFKTPITPCNKGVSCYSKILDDKINTLDKKLEILTNENFSNQLNNKQKDNEQFCLLKGEKGQYGQKINVFQGEEYNSQLYQQLERGIFPKHADLKEVIVNSVFELTNKPWDKKNFFEKRLDELFIEYLPKNFIQFDVEKENQDDSWDLESSEKSLTD